MVKSIREVQSDLHRRSVFLSYSHRDLAVLNELKDCLKPWVKEKRLSIWDDSRIEPGDRWENEIEIAINQASVAVLIVSKNFLASDYIVEKELPIIFKLASANKLRVVWIAATHSAYETTPLKEIQSVNNPRKPLDSLSEPDRTAELVKIAKVISDALVMSTLAGGLQLIDATTEPFEARLQGRDEQAAREFGVQAQYNAPDDSVSFIGMTTRITADDIQMLPPDDREFVSDLEDGMRRNYRRWSNIREKLGNAAGALDGEVESELNRIAILICRDLKHILDFLLKIHKYELEDHYGRYRYICDQLERRTSRLDS